MRPSRGRTILRLVRPSRGRVTLTGGPDARAVQMVFQNPYASLNPRLDVEALLAEPVIAGGGRIDDTVRRRMAALLDRVGLPANGMRRYPHEFSGGQRQRLCIARALMPDPRIVVLDEAVSALDVSVQAVVIELLVGLQRELGLAYLFVSHDMAVVERIAHRVAVLCAGRLVEIGEASRVLASPGHAYTRRLIAAVPAIGRRRQVYRLDDAAMPSLVRPPGAERPVARWQHQGPDHRVRIEEDQDEPWTTDPDRSPSTALPA